MTDNMSNNLWLRPVAALMALSASISSVSAMEKVAVESCLPENNATVTALKQVTLSLSGGDPATGIAWMTGVKAPVTNAEGTEVAYARGQEMPGGFILNLSEEITTPGTYTISVPANTLYSMDWDIFEPVAESYNDAFSLTYNVVDMEPVEVTAINPEDNSSLTGLGQIDIRITGGSELFGYKLVSQAAKVFDESGDEVTYVNYGAMPTGDVLKLKTPLTEPGKYTIVFPEGAMYALDENMKMVYGTENREFSLNYSVVDSPAITFVEASPENGETLESLYEIRTVWSGGDPSVGYGFNGDPGQVTLAGGDGITVTSATIIREGDCYVIRLEEEVNEAGTYTLTIPAGTLWALDPEGNPVIDNKSQEVKLEYTVGISNGINDTSDGRGVALRGRTLTTDGFDNPTVYVYDLTGSLMHNARGSETYLDLNPGVYVVKVTASESSIIRRIVIR